LVRCVEAAGFKYTNVGSLGALAPPLDSPDDALNLVREAKAMAEATSAFRVGVHVSAERMVGEASTAAVADDDNPEGSAAAAAAAAITYDLTKWNKSSPGSPKTGEEVVDLYMEWLIKFQLSYLHDPFHALDTASFMRLKDRLDTEIQRAKELASRDDDGAGGAEDPVLMVEAIGGDPTCHLQTIGDRCCLDDADLDRHHEAQTLNTILLTLSRGKTVSRCISTALKAQSLGWGVVVSVETEGDESLDDFVAHLAVGLRAGQYRGGGLRGSEFTSKYSSLMEIAAKGAVPYAGSHFRNFHT
jgi:enolase